MDPKDKRKLVRSLCYLDVHDQKTGEVIGNANDIHHEGIRLVSKAELPLFEELEINVKSPDRNDSIHLVVKGVWNQAHEEPVHYNTGCQIINTNPEITHAINELIKSLTTRKKNTYSPFEPTATA